MAKEADKEKKEPKEKEGGKEKKEGGDKAPAAAPAPAHPMFSKLGWIVYGSTVALLLVAFVAAKMMFKSPPEQIPEKEEAEHAAGGEVTKDPPSFKIEMTGKDAIIYSIPLNSQATDFRHLKLSMVLTIGRLEYENKPGFSLQEHLMKENFMMTLENLKPHIKDIAIRLLGNYSYIQLQQETFKLEFRDIMRDKVNNKLQQHGMPRRIQEVLFQDYIFSD